MADAAELLAAYDAQLRTHGSDRLPKGVRVERDGPLLRFLGFGGRGLVVYRDLGGLENADLDELIARQVRGFGSRRLHSPVCALAGTAAASGAAALRALFSRRTAGLRCRRPSRSGR